ncbi:MAG TPA: S1/P1 nuclease, partial [Gemmata sp.]|nr:S1/P1 nuclease [Gemmata sp.]
MNEYLVALTALAGICSSASAWNDNGHMTVARIARNELKPEERTKAIDILKSHPHYTEYLKGQKPANMSEDEWVFLRAATWADWVRSGPADRRRYNVPNRHFINLPIVVEGSGITPPKPNDENVVSGIKKQKDEAMTGGDRVNRAVAVTWLFHLVGDIHQPLHCTNLYSKDFPKGDRGGNLAKVRISGGGIVQLHSFWDGLLGTSTSPSSILGMVKEIDDLAAK